MSQQHTHDNGEHVAELHSPGWTTLIHLELVNQRVNTAERKCSEAAELRGALLLGARAIAEESAVAA